MAQCLSPRGCRGKAGEPDHRALARGQVAAGGSVAVELPVANKAHLCPDPCPCLSLGQGLTQQCVCVCVVSEGWSPCREAGALRLRGDRVGEGLVPVSQ